MMIFQGIQSLNGKPEEGNNMLANLGHGAENGSSQV